MYWIDNWKLTVSPPPGVPTGARVVVTFVPSIQCGLRYPATVCGPPNGPGNVGAVPEQSGQVMLTTSAVKAGVPMPPKTKSPKAPLTVSKSWMLVIARLEALCSVIT